MRQSGVIVCLLLVATTYAFSTTSVSPADARRGLEGMNKALKKALSPAFATFATPQKFQIQQQANISLACQAAAAAVGGAFAQCGEVPSIPTQETLAAFCIANCTGGITAAINNALTVCNNPNDRAIFGSEDFEMALRHAQGAVNTICLKEGDAFCLPVVAAIDGSGFDFETVTTTVLDGICSPCVHKLAMAAAATGGDVGLQAAALEVMCHKLNGQYCLIQTRDAIMSMVNMGDQQPDFAAISKAFCNPCFRATITKMAIFDQLKPKDPEDPTDGSADAAEIGRMFSLICSRDDAGNFCINRMSNAMQYEMTFGEEIPCPDLDGVTTSTPCSTECKNFVSGYLQITGCCTRAFFVPAGEDKTVVWAENQCGVKVPPPCQSLRVKGKLVLRNLRLDYVQANRPQVDAAIKRDLANFFDLSPSDIAITGITQNTQPAPAGGFAVQQSAGLAVNYEATPSDSTHANTIKTKAQGATNAPLASVASLPLIAREDPTQPLSFDDADPKDIVVEGSAAGLKAGIAVAAAVVAAALVNLF